VGLYDRLSAFNPASDLEIPQIEAVVDPFTVIDKQIKFWKFYHGKHWDYQKEENNPQVTLNYCKAIVNKQVAFLFKNGFKFSFETKELEDKYLPIFKKVWDEDNKRELVCHDMGQVGGVTGDAYVLITLSEEDDFGMPLSKARVKLTVINSINVIPEWDINNKEKLERITIFYERHSEKLDKKVVYRQVITKDEIAEFENDVLIPGSRRENTIGCIPVVHIKNISGADSSYGISDLEDVVDLNKEYNEKVTDVSDVLDYMGQPIIWIKGASANKIKGTGRIWSGLPVNSAVGILQLNAPMDASIGYLQTLKQSIHEVSNVPEASLGKMQPISNTSGVALHVQYLPLLERVWMKRITYGKGIKHITLIAMQYLVQNKTITKKDLATLSESSCFTIAWNDPLPKDLLNLINIESKKKDLGLASRRSSAEALAIENPERI